MHVISPDLMTIQLAEASSKRLMPPLACEPQTDNLCFSQSNALNWRPFFDDLGQTERLHAAGTASAVLLRIILTERDREIAGWCVC
jgi:hypothetical protein